jgi:UDP-N-acetylmuramate dehydrogenase
MSRSSSQARLRGVKFETEVALAGLTTLELGGPARFVVTPADEAEVRLAHTWAKSSGLPLVVLGGGSNLVAGDAGFDGVVLRAGRLRGEVVEVRGDEVWVTAAAGEPWDAWVAACVGRGWAGVECLAGIPGLVGATPIQNVGAYGQEVSETIRAVRVLDRARDSVVTLGLEDCGFGYRDSVFRRAPDRFIVLAVTFALRAGGKAAVRYAELAAAIAAEDAASPLGADAGAVAGDGNRPSVDLARVSQAVRQLRRGKSMLLDDPADENRRSVGSFFTNPMVSPAEAAASEARAIGLGVLVPPARMPQFPGPDGRVKLSAAWLIERAGFLKGHRQGAVGISSRHALALVHHGGGTTAELLELARAIRDAVHLRFGVELRPEPVFLGTSWT